MQFFYQNLEQLFWQSPKRAPAKKYTVLMLQLHGLGQGEHGVHGLQNEGEGNRQPLNCGQQE